MCHKRETYTVTLRVVVKEPLQVRTYTWCLKVPPRCTKYKVEMRDRIKIQTEVRERVVDVCCAGYASDRTETQCLPVCDGCLHGVCATPDTCSCEPGYTGDRCDTECPEGLWGPTCGLQCQCRNGAACNHISGDCKCTDGWRGSLCDVACPKGTYGHACLEECNCDSDEVSTCHHVTGECSSDDATSEYRELNRPITALPEMHTTATPVLIQPSQTETNDKKDEAASVVQPTEHGAPHTLTNTTMSMFTVPSSLTDKVAETEIPEEIHNSSLASVTPLLDRQTKGSDSGYDRTDTDMDVLQEVQEPETEGLEDRERPTEDPGTTEENASRNAAPARRPVIVVSDGLHEDKGEETASGVSNLVSSASVAGGVALTLIVMATVTTLLVSHRRNKAKMEHQHPTSAPHAYNYTQDVTTLPLRHVQIFPDTDSRRTNDVPSSGALHLSFGDVSGIVTTNNSFGHPYNSYNNARAYLELQYDIPPSCTSSNSNSLRPGMEPEHLYDEIPCWRSTRC